METLADPGGPPAELGGERPVDLPAPIRDRIVATGLALLGSIRADASTRVSPIEVTVHDGRLFVGMMPGSRKAIDVAGDPRVALLTPVADKDDLDGEGKLFGTLRAVEDLDEIAAVFGAATDGTDYDAWVTRSWDPVRGVRNRRRSGATGDVEEAQTKEGRA